MTTAELPIEFGADGLVPAIIVDASTGDVLMVGFQNREALDRTRETGQVHFWSRRRRQLWRKGETSGHIQTVREIRVNCERNSLLIEVNQTGAVCHEGYATCYYRRLEPDNALTTMRDRVFDPADVYPHSDTSPGLGELTRTQFAAYQFIASQPPIPDSRTSALLHTEEDRISNRIADELDELAGVLDGSHAHSDPASDVALEAGQVIYWSMLRCLRDGAPWEAVRPDRALDVTGAVEIANATLARLLQADAAAWRSAPALRQPPNPDRAERDAGDKGVPNRVYRYPESTAATQPANMRASAAVHASLTLVGQALRAFGVDPKGIIARDLAELRTKPYLASFFAPTRPQRPT